MGDISFVIVITFIYNRNKTSLILFCCFFGVLETFLTRVNDITYPLGLYVEKS